MTPQEAKEAQRIAGVLRSARKRSGLSQIAVAQRIGISQSALSKMESGILIPSAPQWFAFCEFTGISPDSLVLGYIDSMRPATLESRNDEIGFKLSKRYLDHRGSKARASLPFLAYFREALGQAKLDRFLEELKIDPDFFISLDSQINLNFCLDLSKRLIEEGVLKANDLPKLTRMVAQPKMHGNLQKMYSGADRVQELLGLLVMNSSRYECNFSYQLEDKKTNRLVLSIKPQAHLSEFEYRDDPTLGDFLCRYKQGYLEKFSTYGDGSEAKEIKVEQVDCHFTGADRCIYRLDLAG